ARITDCTARMIKNGMARSKMFHSFRLISAIARNSDNETVPRISTVSKSTLRTFVTSMILVITTPINNA
ncbi:hypothetical protein D049_0116B, partial [Vibrio parahaemolyticus VPTS-2010]